jgi:hypothetical protein
VQQRQQQQQTAPGHHSSRVAINRQHCGRPTHQVSC